MKFCKHCGTALDPSGKYFAQQVWCREKCSDLARAKRKRLEAREAKHGGSRCSWCQVPVTSSGAGRPKKYCSTAHQREADAARQAARRAERKDVACVQCGCFFEVGVMNDHQRYCSRYCREKVAKAQPFRRRRSYRKHYETVFSRDSGVCQLCKADVDTHVHYLHPLAPTLDHIVPQSANGSDEVSNLRLAHRSCNSRRSNR